MHLFILPCRFAVCRLPPDQEVPQWALSNRSFLSITYTLNELSIVCPSPSVPSHVRCERGWVAIKVRGPLDFSLTGILATMAGLLSKNGIPLFVLSTYDTDYVLVKEEQLARAKEVLERDGHLFE